MRWDVDPELQAQMLSNRVAKTFKHLRARFARRGIQVFRLYDQDIPEIRLAIDWYAGHLVVAEYARRQHDAIPGWSARMAAAVGERLGVTPDHIHLKSRRTRPGEGPRYARLCKSESRIQVREGELKLWVNLVDYLDTGLFSDHRLTRGRVAAEASGKDVLNLYAYTGAFTCAAAQGGARSTVSVDRSGNYLSWAEDNLALNGLAGVKHRFERADCRSYLANAKRGRRTFDIIILDPPSFSTAGDDRALDVQRDHPILVADCLSVLRPGGVLWFSTNHQRFESNLDDVANRYGVELRELTNETVPEDYRNRTVHRCFRITKV